MMDLEYTKIRYIMFGDFRFGVFVNEYRDDSHDKFEEDGI